MILEKVNIIDNKDKFIINSSDHKYTWEYYYRQYNNVLDFIIKIGNKKNYTLNSMAYPILFVFRHTIELMLKNNLQENINTHSIKDLVEANRMPEKFLNNIEILDCDSQGSGLRYYTSYNYKNDTLKVLPIIQFFIDFTSKNMPFALPLKENVDMSDKFLVWEWTFHMRECWNIGILRTQYDSMANLLCEGIINSELLVDDIYLPLLFLIRHSLELGLKGNLYEVKFKNKGHSPVSLYSDFNHFIEDALLNIKEKDLFEETFVKNEKLLNLTSKIKNIDNNSQYFRFPVDQNGHYTNAIQNDIILLDLLDLYYETDSFLSFAIPVLQEYGYISTSNEEYI
ncbi:MAG: hypothetical protein IJ681_05970 [Bacteroidales bacterium]|nr:hypothetical protein [Bacteroidales bacterium]